MVESLSVLYIRQRKRWKMKIWKLKLKLIWRNKIQCITYIHTYITILSGPVASFPLPNLNIYQPMQQKIPYGALPIGQILFTNKLLHQSYTNYGFRISTYHSTDWTHREFLRFKKDDTIHKSTSLSMEHSNGNQDDTIHFMAALWENHERI